MIALGRTARLMAALCLVACQPQKPKPFVESAKFGIFYGGQIEERKQIPFELDPTKQTQGFRVDFGSPLAENVNVEWRVQKPESKKAQRSRRAKRKVQDPAPPETPPGPEHGVVRAGETRFERAVAFEPGDPTGLWNVRVVVRDKVVLDRAFEVFDPKNLAGHDEDGG